jgi:hypothetical protein
LLILVLIFVVVLARGGSPMRIQRYRGKIYRSCDFVQDTGG